MNKIKATIVNGTQTGMQGAQIIIYLFVFFFVLYSMSTFLKTRKKELGICILQGMTDLQLKKLIFLENLFIGFIATGTGIVAGLFMFKGLLLFASCLLDLDDILPVYFPTTALWFTFASFMLLFTIISLFTAIILRTSSLIDLLKATVKPKTEPKASLWLTIAAVVLLLTGYTLAFFANENTVIALFTPVVVLVCMGTYFLFTQLSVYVIHALKRNQTLYRKQTNMLTLSDLAYRMKDNARMFFLVAIIFTVAFTAIGTLVGVKKVTSSHIINNVLPLAYTSYIGNKHEYEHTNIIEKKLKQENVPYNSLLLHFKKMSIEGTAEDFCTMSVSDYNTIAPVKLNVQQGEAIELKYKDVEYHPRSTYKLSQGQTVSLRTGNKLYIKEAGEMVADVRRYIARDCVLIISDSLFRQLPKDETKYIYNVKNSTNLKMVGKQLYQQFQLFTGAQWFSLQVRAVELQQLNQQIGQVMLAGLFIGIVFFVSAGSFLYFRLCSDLDEDLVRYKAISKLGLTEKELSKVVSTQIGLLFFVPIVVAIAHGAVALHTLQSLFPTTSIAKETIIVLSTFFIMQLIYFSFMRLNYVRKLKKVYQY